MNYNALNKITLEMIEFRRWMHAHPELSEKEYETAAEISKILTKYDIEHINKIGGNGIVAIVRGKNGSITAAAKADMDALPITEKNDYDFKSRVNGVMHACGHDANTAILLGTALLMKSIENELIGNVKFFFEPAEETVGGGELMVADGCMEDPKVGAIVGLHVMPYLDTGKIEIKKGCLNANTNEVEINVQGIPGHAAEPENCIDPIVTMSYIIASLQSFVSRNIAATDSVVLTFGMLNAGSKGNIIPANAFAKGTFRTLSNSQREFAKTRITEIAKSIAHGFGASAQVNIIDSYDALINDDELVDLVVDEAKKSFGKESIVIKDKPSMGAEDFSYYTKNSKGVYFHLGCKNPQDKKVCNLHTDDFHLDENCIKIGIEIQTSVLLRMLEQLYSEKIHE